MQKCLGITPSPFVSPPNPCELSLLACGVHPLIISLPFRFSTAFPQLPHSLSSHLTFHPILATFLINTIMFSFHSNLTLFHSFCLCFSPFIFPYLQIRKIYSCIVKLSILHTSLTSISKLLIGLFIHQSNQQFRYKRC